MAVDIPDWTQGHILTPILLGTLQWGSLGGTMTIPIPAGYADFWVTGGGLGFNGVQGSPSGIVIVANPPGVFTLGDVPKSGANFDTGFTLSAAGGVGHSGRVQIYALPATALVYGDPDLPLPVRITQQGGVDQFVNLDQVGGVAVTLGQKTMAASVPVALASDQLGRQSVRPYDAVASNHGVGIGVQGTCTLPATAGKRWTVAHLSVTIYNSNAAAQAGQLQLLDGASVIWGHVYGILAGNGNCYRLDLADLGILGSVGNGVTLKCDAAIVGVYQSVNLGGWLD